MKHTLVALAAALFAAPAAAQANCDPYKTIMAAADRKLEPLKGKARPDGAFQPTVTLPGAGDCSVSEMDWGRGFSCVREFDNEAKARAAASASLAEARQCLAGWLQQPVTLPPDDTEIIAGAKFTKPAYAPNTTFSIVLHQEALKDQAIYRVGVNIAWFND